MARHIYHCPLRWSDMDAFGHVNNVVFVRYLEEARIDFMFRPVGEGEGDGEGDGGGVGFADGTVVARHEIDYVRPLVHRHDPVVIEMWVTRITPVRVFIAYEIRDPAEDGGTVYARAATVVVPYDLQAQRPRRLSDAEYAFLEHYLDDGDGGEDGTGSGDGPAGDGAGAGREALVA